VTALSESSKDRWSAAHTQVKVTVEHELAAAFKAACIANKCTVTGVLSKFMADYCQATIKLTANKPYENRRKRRIALKSIIAQMEQLMAAEGAFIENVPENLQGSKWHDAAEQSFALMQEVIDIMTEIY
jgi:hypothetical protein